MIVGITIVAGLLVGSFLTALLHRLHTGASMWNDRSRCPHCEAALSARELIPLVSFMLQRGRCRHCGKPISWQYPVIVGGTALLFGLIAWQQGSCTSISCGGSLALFLFWAALAVGVAVYDLRWMLIPDELLVAGAIVALVSFPFWQAPDMWSVFSLQSLVSRLGGAAIAGGLLLAFFAGSRGRAMGFGDVKLAALLGFALGWREALVMLVLAFVAGGLIGTALLVAKKATRRSKMPFGPYLAGAGLLALIWGGEIISWYVWRLSIFVIVL